MRGLQRTFILILAICFALSLSLSCAKKGMVKGEGESAEKEASVSTEKPAEIKEEVVAAAPAEEKEMAGMEEKSAQEVSFSNIFFDFDQYLIRPEDRPELEKVADFMGKNSSAKLLIEGHCDERGTSEYNFALGERRAQAAKDYLVNLGTPGSRIKTISYGEEKPADPGHDEAAWAKNRRGHFVILK